MKIDKNKIKAKEVTKRLITRLPQDPGIYIFWTNKKRPLYVGKALNLKNRIKSYFVKGKLPGKTKRMVTEAKVISTIRVNSELEALLLEAKFIRGLKPKYNTELKDDKHPLYIKITKEKYPRVQTARKIEEKEKNMAFFGPFPSSSNVYSVLRMLRKIFPYAEHKVGKRACIRSQIGLCNPCPSEIENLKDKEEKEILKSVYLKNIKMIKGVLSGGIKFVRNSLVKDMKGYAENENFEDAKRIREQVEKLDYITQSVTPISLFLKNPMLLEDIRHEELKDLKKTLSKFIKAPQNLTRIECFDVSHLSGTQPAASMVTFINGEPDKSYYRHFRIRQKKGEDDIASLTEVANRRSKYLSSWGTPDLIIVDGGKGQVAAFFEVFSKHKILVVGLAKRMETLVFLQKKGGKREFSEFRLPKTSALNLIQRLRDEAHRFARRYHHKLVETHLFRKIKLKNIY